MTLLSKDNQSWLDELGLALSNHIKCAVVLDSRVAKPSFTCKCGVSFPVFSVQGAVQYNIWNSVLARHRIGNSYDGGIG
jgi:hypothetical protein